MRVGRDGCLTMPESKEGNMERMKMMRLILLDGTALTGMKLIVSKEVAFMCRIRYPSAFKAFV